MAVVVTGRDEMFGAWCAKRIPAIGTIEAFGKFRAVGIATGNLPTDRLMAVWVFHDYHPKFEHCQMSGAGVDPHWLSRPIVRAVLSIPFLQYNCNKVWCAIPHTNERVIRLGKALGFRHEATLKDHFGRGTHAEILRMMKGYYEQRYWPNETKAA